MPVRNRHCLFLWSKAGGIGQKVWEADYKPFGEEFSVVASDENAKRFVGKEKDVETDLNYFGARYLNTGIGRFLAPDAVRAVDAQSGQINAALLVNPQRHNVYAYSLNNPYRYVDSDGLWAEAVLFEIPSIAVGAHSFVDNIKQGNWSAAVVDAGGVAVDVVAAAIPGVPGGAGLSVKATRAMKVAPAAAKKLSKRATIRKAKLPIQVKGKVRYIPPKNWKASEPLPRGVKGGYMDKFGNEWTKGPSRTKGQSFEWDVQRPDGTHWNISLDGKVTH